MIFSWTPTARSGSPPAAASRAIFRKSRVHGLHGQDGCLRRIFLKVFRVIRGFRAIRVLCSLYETPPLPRPNTYSPRRAGEKLRARPGVDGGSRATRIGAHP